jgi:hypothetical protein
MLSEMKDLWMYPHVNIPFMNIWESVIPIVYISYFLLSLWILWLVKRDKRHNSFRRLLLITHLFNIVFQTNGMVVRYVVRSRHLYFLNLIMLTVNGYFICNLQIQVLKIFKILDSRISEFRITVLQSAVLVTFIVCIGPILSRPFLEDFPHVLMLGLPVWAFFTVLFDNALVLLMARMIFITNKKRKQESVLSAFRKVVSVSVIIMIMDWVTLGFTVWMFGMGAEVETIHFNILEFAVCFAASAHCALIYLVFLNLRGLALTGISVKPLQLVQLPQTAQTVRIASVDTKKDNS